MAGQNIVGFGEAGVVVALGDGQGGFSYNFRASQVITDFGYAAGGWRVDKHPRFLAAVTSNGWSDVVGFGDDADWIVSVPDVAGRLISCAFLLLPLFLSFCPQDYRGPAIKCPLDCAAGGTSGAVSIELDLSVFACARTERPWTVCYAACDC